MSKNRPLLDRLHDRSWTEISKLQTLPNPHPGLGQTPGSAGSVSGTHPWPKLCESYANGTVSSKNFRRILATREIVETLGPVDGRFFAAYSRLAERDCFSDPIFKKINEWGDPVMWPGILLGTPSACSPTALRYLAHSIWLAAEGIVREGGNVVELGVGYGGLAAMNHWRSGTVTHLVDLPGVVDAALKMLASIHMESAAIAGDSNLPEDFCFVSNYAFTELSSDLQDGYFDTYLARAPRGVIISNANVFAREIGGRTDADLLKWFRNNGLDARVDKTCPILGPADRSCEVSIIRW